MRLSLLFSLIACSNAFAPMVPVTRPVASQLSLMSNDETANIMKQATECYEGECSIDEVDDLIGVMHAQQKELSLRLDDVRSMIKSLEVVNGKDDRAVDEIRETVRAIYRVFQLGDKASGNDYPALSKPMGYSGEVGKGPTTAYDALPPKKWKPSP